MKPRRLSRHGFTLVELLTVIAIIAVLAAIIFPVTATVRRNVRQKQCAAQQKQLVEALKIYKDDFGSYPIALSQYAIGTTSNTIVPQLFPQYITSESTFTCPISQTKPRPESWVPAAGATLTAGCAPGGGAPDPCWIAPLDRSTGQPVVLPLSQPPVPYLIPEGDTYGMQLLPDQSQQPPASTWELHYSRLWTNSLAGQQQDQRTLAVRNPSEQTVVTWCLYHAKLDAQGAPRQGDIAIVSFLDGRVQNIGAEKLTQWAAGNFDQLPFRVFPNP